MIERQMWWKVLLIGAACAIAYQASFPLDEKLKFGIDLSGGYSLLYEIDDANLPADQKKDIAEKVMRTLQERVDPEGVMNLVWRPVGTNRLEIQMPRPSESVLKNRAEYDQLRDELRKANLKRGEIVSALARPASERPAAIQALLRGVPSRQPLLEELAKLEDSIRAAQGKTTTQAVNDLNDAEDKFDQKMDELLAKNIDLGRVQTIQESAPKSKSRKEELDKLVAASPESAELVKKLVAAYDNWRQRKGREGTLDDPADLERLLRGAGVLEYRMLAESDAADPNRFEAYRENLRRNGPRPRPGEETFEWFEIEKPRDFFKHNPDLLGPDFDRLKLNQKVVIDKHADKYYVLAYISSGKALTHRPGETEWTLQSASPSRDDQGKPAVAFELDEKGGVRFEAMTRANKGKLLCIFLDDKAVSYASIEGIIRTRGIIHGSFSVKEVQELVKKLNAGSLPRKLKEPPISVRAIGPSLGESNRKAGMLSAYLGGGAVTIFMIVYYYYAGIIAVMAMMMNVLMTIAVLGMMGATLTLPGVAGLVLSVGMAVDSNILINERIREEQEKGAGLRTAIRLGYEHAFNAIIDSHVTTFLTSVILYWIASEEIKGFGLTLAAGVVLNLFTAVFVTRIFFEFMAMSRVPGEIVRFPLTIAAGIGAAGAALWGAAHFLTSPENRVSSTSIGFGKLLVYTAVATGVIYLMMGIARGFHHLVRPDPNGRLPMLKLIGVPRVDWYGLRRGFYAMSLVLTIGGLAAFFMRDKTQLYDIEFLGGTAAQIDLKQAGSAKEPDIEKRLRAEADRMRAMADAITNKSQISVKGNEVTITTPGVPTSRMEDFVKADLGAALQANGVRVTGPEQVTLIVRSEENPSEQWAQAKLKALGKQVRTWASDIADAQVQAEAALEPGARSGESFEIVSRVTSKEVLVSSLLSCMSDIVDIPQQVSFQLVKDAKRGGADYFPIRENDLAKVTGDASLVADVSEWKGGVGVVLTDLNPPQSVESMEKRLKAMRLQPGFEQYGWRATQVVGLKAAAGSPNLFTQAAVLVSDENYPLEESSQSSEAWRSRLAEPEVKLVRDAMERQTSLGKITQFAPQVARESETKAIIALVLSWLAIILYLWIRFGKVTWGGAAVIALVHDVCVALGMIAVSYYLSQTAIGKALLIENFRIDLAMVAALLTVVGYSVNDTIIVFDRIRENRGRGEDIRPSLVNNAINQTLSRTILTVFTVLIVVLIMYIFGGRGIHGFMYAMLVGILTGTYSSVYVASPLLVALYKRVTKPVRGAKPQPAVV